MGIWLGDEPVPGVSNGQKMFRMRGVGFKRLAQSKEELVDASGLHVPSHVPDFRQEFLPADHATFIFHEVAEQLKLLVGEFYLFVINPNLIGIEVDMSMPEIDFDDFGRQMVRVFSGLAWIQP